MKKGTNMVFLGLLSLIVGTVFASPLLVSELKIRPFLKPLPKGVTADMEIDVVYVNFSIGDSDENNTEVSYFVVLNITNNSDEWATIRRAEFIAARNITKGKSIQSGSRYDMVGGFRIMNDEA